MVVKFCEMGKVWNHGDRIRNNVISLSLCPLYLTYKDHKGWKGENDSPPPTRPIAGGNTGMNLHISETLSEMVEPMVDAYIGAREIISTEDFKAGMEELNDKNYDWYEFKWWEGKTTNDWKYICCNICTRATVRRRNNYETGRMNNGSMDNSVGVMINHESSSMGEDMDSKCSSTVGMVNNHEFKSMEVPGYTVDEMSTYESGRSSSGTGPTVEKMKNYESGSSSMESMGRT